MGRPGLDERVGMMKWFLYVLKCNDGTLYTGCLLYTSPSPRD